MQIGFSSAMLALDCATLSSTEYRVANYLASVALSLTSTTFWHTDAMICAATNLTPNTVRKCRAALVAAGMIDYTAGTHKGSRSRYTLHFLTAEALRHNAERQLALAAQLAGQASEERNTRNTVQPTRSESPQQSVQNLPALEQQSPQQSPQNLHLLNTNSLSQHHIPFAESFENNNRVPPSENEVREYLMTRHNIPLSIAGLIAISFCALWRFRNWRDEATGRCIIPHWHDRADGYFALSKLRFEEQTVRLGIALAKQEEQQRYHAQIQAERAARQAKYDADYAADREARQAQQSFGKYRKPSHQLPKAHAQPSNDAESGNSANRVHAEKRWEFLDRKIEEERAARQAGEPEPAWGGWSCWVA